MSRRVELRSAAEIEPTAVDFLFRDRIPASTLTLLLGIQGWGKTTLLVHLLSLASRGRLPGDFEGKAMTCLMASAEDDIETTLLPRFIAAGADLERIHFVTVQEKIDDHPEAEGGLILPDDVALLGSAARTVGAGLIGLDPISAYLSGGIDAHKDADVRRGIAPLTRLANETGIGIIGVGHFNKGASSDPLQRALGSTAWTAAPRSVLVFGPDPDCDRPEQTGKRLLAHAKCNVGPRARSIRCLIDSDEITAGDRSITTSRLTFGAESDHSASDVLSVVTDEEKTARTAAADFLEANLNGVPIRSKDLFAAARKEGISESTLRRAQKQIGIEAVQQSDGWYWQRPEQADA